MADARRNPQMMSNRAAASENRFRFREANALRAKAEELGLDLPWSDDVASLLEPTRVGDVTLPNRLAVQPMEACDAEPDGSPGAHTLRRYTRYAAGGAGLIWFEATAVLPEGRANPRQLYLHEGNAAEFTRLVRATRQAAHDAHGDDHEPLLILQLTHSGRWSKPSGTRQPVIAHHNPDLDRLVGVNAHYPVITDDELEALESTMLAAARLAARAGFDGVDVKSCHGYLASELLAARTRPGRFGGSLLHRMRFLLDTIRSIREEVPTSLVTSRINAYDGLPHPFGFGADEADSSRADLTEPLALLREMEESGCPLGNVSIGVPYWRPHLGRPFDRPVPGSAPSPEHPLVGVVRLLRIVGELQLALPQLPLVGTGYSWLRHHFPNVGAGAVERGEVSLVGVGRMAFAYPDFACDLREKGGLDYLKSCCACSGCTQLLRSGDEAGCVVRDRGLYRLPRKPRAAPAP
ncbi:MAG: flavin oxidoreductase/NADH oxidase [Gemmatimonadales bacterium]|nr:flavin oxidoreductase/NADH oxidase [Gemmatimonadales bacterium]NIN10474.1 flavin oxidoreductase/NADH oxidase [Gemmatimonadales bacterium]NIQ98934.1 flavin oxidoreductase/NADH oxidase [Gemmatimonadales bacterium]NIS63762.1 flavin oxidoreductase/NADH oxidase [Gemmatimonadales bacterium]